jgi:hypothetical protein
MAADKLGMCPFSRDENMALIVTKTMIIITMIAMMIRTKIMKMIKTKTITIMMMAMTGINDDDAGGCTGWIRIACSPAGVYLCV